MFTGETPVKVIIVAIVKVSIYRRGFKISKILDLQFVLTPENYVLILWIYKRKA